MPQISEQLLSDISDAIKLAGVIQILPKICLYAAVPSMTYEAVIRR
jgi:hypothetical protein